MKQKQLLILKKNLFLHSWYIVHCSAFYKRKINCYHNHHKMAQIIK